ncbi:MAG: 16S rRNA (guanine(966)-N(2))-methyltransferase RsmD, partial [Planctomycetota bacterium]
MRVIGGTCRGRKLLVPEDRSVRPVRDAVREALFNILGDWIVGRKVLDLYAGSGSLGIEALSRGAVKGVFVEYDSPTAEVLESNLRALDLSESSDLSRENVLNFLARAGTSDNKRGFHAVFADPPFSYSGSPSIADLVSALSAPALWG